MITARLAHSSGQPQLCAFFDGVRECWFPNNVVSHRLREVKVRVVMLASGQDALKQLHAALAIVKRVKPSPKRRPIAKKKRGRK